MAERDTGYRKGDYLERGVAGTTIIEAGKMGAINTDGYVVEASDSTTVSFVVGRIEATVDNSAGSDGDVNGKIRRKEVFQWDNDGTGDGMISMPGVVAYVKDDMTVSAETGTAGIKAGHVLDVDADGVWVDHDIYNQD